MGASESSHTATMVPAPWMPLVWWIAPDTPSPMYRRGEIVSPVWPIWALRSIQPSSQATRVAPTAAPSGSARERTRSKSPSTPRPPTTTVRASVRGGPAAAPTRSRETTRTAREAGAASTSSASTRAARPDPGSRPSVSAPKAPGRTASTGVPSGAGATDMVVDQEPESTSLEARSSPSTTSRAATSDTQAEPSRIAARPAISLPR